eukprot:scaffold53116_cov63-Phaeocystis_antarctica.AAC.2
MCTFVRQRRPPICVAAALSGLDSAPARCSLLVLALARASGACVCLCERSAVSTVCCAAECCCRVSTGG